MAKDTGPDFVNASQADQMPEQSEPGTYDICRSEARDEVRQIFQQIGLTPARAATLGLNLSPLDVEDEDD